MRSERLATAAMNVLWLVVTAALLAVVHYLWPYQHWSWALVLGAGAGGSGVFLTVWIAARTRLPRMLEVNSDAQ